MKSIFLILFLSTLISFETQILAKDSNEEDTLHNCDDSESNSLKLSPSHDNQNQLLLKDKVQKREVGVIYRDDRPVGILQPFKRTYRFIPVREELLENDEENQKNQIVNKRNIKSNTENKRNDENNGKFNDELTNILDDMSLIGNDETINNKRQMNHAIDDNKPLQNTNEILENRNKRNNHYLNNNADPNPNQQQNKREKQNINNKLSQVDLNQNNDSGGVDDDDDDEEKRIARRIHNKINSLRDQVKREIEAIKQQQQQDPDDLKRKKRNIENNLIDKENNFIDPIKQSDATILEPLIRNRRNIDDPSDKNSELNRLKRRIDEEVQDRPQQLSDLSDSELFGALPNGFDGELSRYKRVKRAENQ